MSETEQNTGAVDCRQIAATSVVAGRQFAVVAPHVRPDDVALQGHFGLHSLRSGLRLHATDAVDLHDLTTQIVRKPGLTVALFLDGVADISLGRNRFRLGGHEAPPPLAFALSCAEPDLFVRRGMRGSRVRKVGVTIPPDWFDSFAEGDGSAVRRFAATHASVASWRPTPRQMQLAEQLLAPAPYGPLLEGLYQESRALEIVAEAVGVLEGHGSPPAAPRLCAREKARLRAICEFVDGHEADELRLEEIARHAGMSVSAMQRLFRAAHGMSVFEYARVRRLERARLLLERDRVSVTEAAYTAGYGSPANFATAFKRQFGISPSDARRRIR